MRRWLSYVLLWVAGLVWFATPPAAETRVTPTDAIVVLTGGSLRLQSGIDLLREGKGRVLFVSGVNAGTDLDELLRASGNAPQRLTCCILLGHLAENTHGNARETALWMRQRGYRSLRLVTAWYHMPRSLVEFRRAMPEISIIAHPVFPAAAEPGRPSAWHREAALLLGEYDKYLAALFRLAFDPAEPPAAAPVETGVRP